jgi:hypothetical protein
MVAGRQEGRQNGAEDWIWLPTASGKAARGPANRRDPMHD